MCQFVDGDALLHSAMLQKMYRCSDQKLSKVNSQASARTNTMSKNVQETFKLLLYFHLFKALLPIIAVLDGGYRPSEMCVYIFVPRKTVKTHCICRRIERLPNVYGRVCVKFMQSECRVANNIPLSNKLLHLHMQQKHADFRVSMHQVPTSRVTMLVETGRQQQLCIEVQVELQVTRASL